MKTADLVKDEDYCYSTKKDPLRGSIDKVTIIDPTPCYGIAYGDDTKVKQESDKQFLGSTERGFDCAPYNRILVRNTHGHLRGVLARYIVCTWPDFGRRLIERDKQEKQERRRQSERNKVLHNREANIVAALRPKGIEPVRNHICQDGAMVLSYDSLEKLLNLAVSDEGTLMKRGA